MSSEPNPVAPTSSRPRRSVLRGAAILIVGAGLGVGAATFVRRPPAAIVMPLTAAPIAQLSRWSWGPVTVKGRVVDIFGNKFVLHDDSGRALVETGPSGAWGNLVATDETVTVQGRFAQGFIHASVILHSDGRSDAVGPPRGRRGHWRLSWFRADAGRQLAASAPGRLAMD